MSTALYFTATTEDVAIGQRLSVDTRGFLFADDNGRLVAASTPDANGMVKVIAFTTESHLSQIPSQQANNKHPELRELLAGLEATTASQWPEMAGIVADWLEEHGDLRAQSLRTRLRMLDRTGLLKQMHVDMRQTHERLMMQCALPTRLTYTVDAATVSGGRKTAKG